MSETKTHLPKPEVDPKKWTPEEKAKMKKLAKAAIRLWSMVLFGGGSETPIKSLFGKNKDPSV